MINYSQDRLSIKLTLILRFLFVTDRLHGLSRAAHFYIAHIHDTFFKNLKQLLLSKYNTHVIMYKAKYKSNAKT